MADQPMPAFRVAYPEAIRQQLRAWGQQATEKGIISDYVAALRHIDEQLGSAPETWGDPVARMRNLKLIVHRRIYWNINIRYAVHAEKRLVFVLSCELVLNHPLIPKDDKPSGNGRA